MSAYSLRILFAFLLTASAAGCGRSGDVVRVALAVPLTGDTGSEGQGLRRAVALAVEEANASGRFPYRIELKALDDRGDPREAVNVANLIISDPRVAAVIGHYNSGCAIPAAPIYAKAGLPMIVPSASSPKVTAQQLEPGWRWPRNVFRIVPTDDIQGAYVGEFLHRELGVRRLAVIHDGTPYGQGLAEHVRDQFLRRGGQLLAFEEVTVGRKDFRPLLRRIGPSAPDAVYFGGLYTEAGLILKQMRELGLRAAFFSGDASKTTGLFAVAGEAADGAYLSMIGIPVEYLPGAQDFVRAYRERYPGAEIKPFDHFGYEAAWIVLDALAAAGPDRGRLLAAIRRTDRRGLLGRTRFDAKGDTINRVIFVTRADARTRSFEPLR